MLLQFRFSTIFFSFISEFQMSFADDAAQKNINKNKNCCTEESLKKL